METITNTLRDSKVARWTALTVVSFTMLFAYYMTDVMAPLKPMIIFTSFGILALLFAFLLKAEDRKKKYGLELPNIEQNI